MIRHRVRVGIEFIGFVYAHFHCSTQPPDKCSTFTVSQSSSFSRTRRFVRLVTVRIPSTASLLSRSCPPANLNSQHSTNLLRALLVLNPRRYPWPYFWSWQDNATFSSMRGRVGLSVTTLSRVVVFYWLSLLPEAKILSTTQVWCGLVWSDYWLRVFAGTVILFLLCIVSVSITTRLLAQGPRNRGSFSV